MEVNSETNKLREAANELREAAKFIESEGLAALTTYSDISFIPVVGDLQYFPRSTTEDRAAMQGFGVLQGEVEEIVAILHALATVMEQELPIPDVLLMRVEPYLAAFRRRGDNGRLGSKD